MEIAFKIFNLGVFLHSLVSMVYYKRGGCYRHAVYMYTMDDSYKPYLKIHRPLWSPFVQILTYPGWIITSWFADRFISVMGFLLFAIILTLLRQPTRDSLDSNDIVEVCNTNAFMTELLFILVTGVIFLNT
jgi:hypothetical protein